jgi:hypothetical protein
MLNVEERTKKAATDIAVGVLINLCGRIWQKAHGVEIGAPSGNEIIGRIMPLLKPHLEAAQREAMKEVVKILDKAVRRLPPREALREINNKILDLVEEGE